MESVEQEHHHYWPGDGTIPITPQAVRFGYVFPVYVTNSCWAECITWTPRKGVDTSAEKRIYDLLDSCYKGMGKRLASEPDSVAYTFKHWFWDRLRPKAKKPTKAKYGARLLLDPETEEPWLLIFCPDRDGKEVLKYGEPETDRGNETPASELGLGDDASVADANAEEGVAGADDAFLWPAEGGGPFPVEGEDGSSP